MTKIKICGITRPEDALEASLWGADALGFNFSRKSPRRIDADTARAIVARLPPLVSAVGVFVEQPPEEVADLCRFCNLQAAQLHSDEYDADKTLRIEGVRVIRVFRPGPGFSVEEVRSYAEQTGCRGFLFDAFSPAMAGGTGKTIESSTASMLFDETRDAGWALLAGGLKPENVADAVRLVRPWGVDTASGVESSPGVKDALKIRRFIEAVREADRSLTNCC
ncbi:phosphoribosylanthranilate isomerase [Chlorobaculum sp. 24CR]|uniref:phosphoribosylanthranilate isomerase n=1 Tax=Chlorobaculum sp. 24CR TaxID=2508878 RepID=UPI00100A779D|nr:phosphoribosylanthranilate isomerase [Chlorobaculum sp. 24CR]RXK88953.1 phosphoribosylanthranilate isomerase [Chlorobaculum sp. 24CR]